jgi:hypothetical protein
MKIKNLITFKHNVSALLRGGVFMLLLLSSMVGRAQCDPIANFTIDTSTDRCKSY